MSVAVLEHTRGVIHAEPSVLPAVDAALELVSLRPDDFVLPIEGSALPSACIDGRSALGQGVCPSGVRLAGGTLSVWLADVWPRLQALSTGQAALADLADFCRSLRASGWPVATHSDDHSPEGACGCGAADVVGKILGIMAKESAYIDSLLSAWGLPALSPDLTLRALKLRPLIEGRGPGLFSAIGPHCVVPPPQLSGAHREVAIVANCRAFSSVRRELVEAALEECGVAAAQVFVVDVWACRAIADELGLGEQASGVIAAFNVATALRLCGDRMRVLTLH